MNIFYYGFFMLFYEALTLHEDNYQTEIILDYKRKRKQRYYFEFEFEFMGVFYGLTKIILY